MDQISKTVNGFVAWIIGASLLCITSFVVLLASAQLNNSVLGDLFARFLGETARTARNESLVYWERVSTEVGNGLGFSAPLFSVPQNPLVTPIVIFPTVAPNVTAAASVVATPNVPSVTPVPRTYIRSSAYSEGALLLWRGLDPNQQRSEWGVSLNNIKQQVNVALQQAPGDLLAIWLNKRLAACEPVYNRLVQADYTKSENASMIIADADVLLRDCNPRLYEAYARRRWAQLAAWTATEPIELTKATDQLAGLTLVVGNKVDGFARMKQATDVVEVSIQSLPQFSLGKLNFHLPSSTLDALLGESGWVLNSGPYLVPGVLFPIGTSEPVLPTEAEIDPNSQNSGAAVAPSGDAAAQPKAVGPGGTYVVQPGDTISGIATALGIDANAFVQLNLDIIGGNPNYIYPGMELRLP
jgi:LysM repeat protein